jgi:hypothetical protein
MAVAAAMFGAGAAESLWAACNARCTRDVKCVYASTMPGGIQLGFLYKDPCTRTLHTNVDNGASMGSVTNQRIVAGVNKICPNAGALEGLAMATCAALPNQEYLDTACALTCDGS